ncbi:hypothetical protein QOT17_003619 [Balamuthia mandrillaris]
MKNVVWKQRSTGAIDDVVLVANRSDGAPVALDLSPNVEANNHYDDAHSDGEDDPHRLGRAAGVATEGQAFTIEACLTRPIAIGYGLKNEYSIFEYSVVTLSTSADSSGFESMGSEGDVGLITMIWKRIGPFDALKKSRRCEVSKG